MKDCLLTREKGNDGSSVLSGFNSLNKYAIAKAHNLKSIEFITENIETKTQKENQEDQNTKSYLVK